VTPSPGSFEDKPPEHHAQLGVECPQCHFRQFVQVEFDKPELNPPMVLEIRAQLAAWMASHCPDHLKPILSSTKN
jgi:hypothetical protein